MSSVSPRNLFKTRYRLGFRQLKMIVFLGLIALIGQGYLWRLDFPEQLPLDSWYRILPGLVLLLVSFFLLRFGFFRVRFLSYAIVIAWVLGELSFSVYLHNGFRFVFVSALGLFCSWIGKNIEDLVDRADVNPDLRWFEGALRVALKTDGQLTLDDQNQEFQFGIRRMDAESVFIVLRSQPEKRLSLNQRVKVRFADLPIVDASVTSLLSRGETGIGLQFLFTDLYHQDRLGQWIQDQKARGLA